MTGMPPEGTWVVYFIRAVGSNGFEFWSRVKGGRRRWAWDMRGIVDRVLLDRVDKLFICILNEVMANVTYNMSS